MLYKLQTLDGNTTLGEAIAAGGVCVEARSALETHIATTERQLGQIQGNVTQTRNPKALGRVATARHDNNWSRTPHSLHTNSATKEKGM